jgi:hypothetical protein
VSRSIPVDLSYTPGHAVEQPESLQPTLLEFLRALSPRHVLLALAFLSPLSLLPTESGGTLNTIAAFEFKASRWIWWFVVRWMARDISRSFATFYYFLSSPTPHIISTTRFFNFDSIITSPTRRRRHKILLDLFLINIPRPAAQSIDLRRRQFLASRSALPLHSKPSARPSLVSIQCAALHAAQRT